MGSEGCKRDLRAEDFVLKVDSEDGFAVSFGGKIDEKAAWKAADGGFVKVERTVGGNHDEGGKFIHSVPFSEKLVDEFTVGSTVG